MLQIFQNIMSQNKLKYECSVNIKFISFIKNIIVIFFFEISNTYENYMVAIIFIVCIAHHFFKTTHVIKN